MFVGTVTKFANGWQIEPVPANAIQEDVAKALKDLTIGAIDAGVSFVWLSWPYYETKQGDMIHSLLKDFNNEILKRYPVLKRRTRLGKAPTKLIHAEQAQLAVLYIGG